MRESSLSRRNAAMLIAGTFGIAAAPIGAAAAVHGEPAPVGDVTREHIVRLVRRVREASGPQSRARAFARCKAALQARDAARAIGKAVRPQNALYTHADAGATLTRVLVRELDAWPVADPGWLRRFDDLAAHVLAEV